MPISRDPMPDLAMNRVPEVTVDFWLIKLMAVTMGETAADYLAVNLGLGLTMTSLIMAGFLIGALVLQFVQKRYVPLRSASPSVASIIGGNWIFLKRRSTSSSK